MEGPPASQRPGTRTAEACRPRAARTHRLLTRAATPSGAARAEGGGERSTTRWEVKPGKSGSPNRGAKPRRALRCAQCLQTAARGHCCPPPLSPGAASLPLPPGGGAPRGASAESPGTARCRPAAAGFRYALSGSD